MRKLLLIAFVVSLGCSAQSTVRQFLNLTDTQVSAIQKLNDDYNKLWFAQQDRLFAINQELTAILAAESPDPVEIGKRAVETELIRRDRVARQKVLQQQVSALLTLVQASTVQTLISAESQQPLVNDAACAYLVNSSYSPNFLSGLLYGGIFQFFSPLPYIPPASTGTFCGFPAFPTSVRDYLALTDAQVAAIQALSAAYNNDYARQQIRINELNFEIADLNAAPGTDPVVLGLRYAEIASIGKQIADRGKQLRNAARQQLTPAQSATLKGLQDIQSLADVNLFNIASGCNLVPDSAAPPATGPVGSSSFCLL